MKLIKFSQLKPGDKAVIIDMQSVDVNYRRRLYALGLRPGVIFQLSQQTPFGDPSVIDVSGTRLCLRAAEANNIVLEQSS